MKKAEICLRKRSQKCSEIVKSFCSLLGIFKFKLRLVSGGDSCGQNYSNDSKWYSWQVRKDGME